MNLFDPNESHTVGIITGLHTSPSYMGTFTPRYLREWSERLCKEYGDDAHVKIDLHHCVNGKTCSFLCASEDGREPFVSVAGHEVVK